LSTEQHSASPHAGCNATPTNSNFCPLNDLCRAQFLAGANFAARNRRKDRYIFSSETEEAIA
jgi:hypothetical protein